MTSRERILAAINHQIPDKMPTDLGTSNTTSIVLRTYAKLKKYYSLDKEVSMMFEPFQIVIPDEEILQKLQIDTRGLPGNYSAYEARKWINEQEYIDRFGVLYRMPENGLYYDFYKAPLDKYETVDEAEREYIWPEAVIPEEVEGLRKKAQLLKQENQYAIIGDIVNSGIWERSQNIRGFENMLMDIIANKEMAHYVLRNIVDHQKQRMKQYLDEIGEYLDVVCAYDDLATGQNTVMSIDVFREMVKPYLAEYWSFIKANAPNAKLMYHSCGAIEPFIDDLIEIGMDILNPIQGNASGMDTKKLKEKYGKRLVFWGAIDAQYVMVNGAQEDVQLEVEKRISDLGPTGYVLCENHNIQADVPIENVIEMYTHAKKVKIEGR